ncbi:hypothetical protein, conserved [Babesia bigemina]|uniref:Uncharacterized protein n=1 Tax=Babesia bigemina TaxID=5866 RepID=A0A061DEM7_BABBI|nr:hypothetical protein, conserved [Babesia bigemina]CDR97550.1 hypothetical protein, conserved [Babesia bigemina]|eukprot:XP_012769736.1 hypothetical protein, conserved [Babesia bigemina]
MREDERFVSLRGCRRPSAHTVTTAEVCVLWASTIVSKRGFQSDELLHIARNFARSEFSHFAVQVVIPSPFCMCRIYSNGRVVIMGNLTEGQVEKELSRVVYKLRYRTKWKVSTLRDRITHGNGLQWCYVVNNNVLPVKTVLQSVKVDQLYCRVAFDGPIDLRLLLQRGLSAKQNITSISNACVRLQIDLPEPPENSTGPAESDPTTSVWDAGLELERELEAELAHLRRQDKRFATCVVYHSGKVAILGCCNHDEVRFTFDALATLL